MKWIEEDEVHKLLVDWFNSGEEVEVITLIENSNEHDVCRVKININDELKGEHTFYYAMGIDMEECKRVALVYAKEMINDEIRHFEELLKMLREENLAV